MKEATSWQIGKNAIQITGITALLDAVRAGASGSLQVLGLDGVTITLELEKTLKEMQESHPHLKVVHGGTGGYLAPKPLPTPIEKLTKYCKDNSVRLIDLFRTFDKEQYNSLPEEEFRNALKVCLHVPVLLTQWNNPLIRALLKWLRHCL